MSKEKIKTEEPTNKTEENITQEGKVGTMLRDVRTKNKISIEQVASDLRIKSTYISAIENSDYANIPAHPYGIGFVRSYASYLGLNSNRITQIFKEETENKTSSSLKNKTYNTEEKTENNSQNTKYLLISLGMLLLGYVLWNVFSAFEGTTNQDTNSSVEEEASDFILQVDNYNTSEENSTEANTQTENQNMISEETVSEANTYNIEKANTEAPIPQSTADNKIEAQIEDSIVSTKASEKKNGRVILKIKKETWIEVRDSHQEKLWISKVLNAGDEYVIPENGENKIVSFGNTDGVDVLIDGEIVTIISKNKKTNIKLDAFLGNN